MSKDPTCEEVTDAIEGDLTHKYRPWDLIGIGFHNEVLDAMGDTGWVRAIGVEINKVIRETR